MSSIILGHYASRIVVVAQTLPLPYEPTGHQEHYWLALVEQLHRLEVFLLAVLLHSVYEPPHVGELLRTDYQSLLRVLPTLQLHQTVVLLSLLQLDALPQSHHLPHVLADQCPLRNVSIRYYIVPLVLNSAEDVGSNGHPFVLLISPSLLISHEVDAEVHAVLIQNGFKVIDVNELLRVEHILVLYRVH